MEVTEGFWEAGGLKSEGQETARQQSVANSGAP